MGNCFASRFHIRPGHLSHGRSVEGTSPLVSKSRRQTDPEMKSFAFVNTRES